LVFNVTFATSGTFTGTLAMQVTTVTMAQFQASQASLDQLLGGFAISDTAADVSVQIELSL
jgi:hypothetical protein